ncbi:MAG: hypothetical protein IJJ74_03800, partial [Eubacterium sp.]|nr:hypothetical protein [Eubacterium sp.]
VGTERHESRRVDRQLRGRSGRQGDPGSSVFFVSIEDKLEYSDEDSEEYEPAPFLFSELLAEAAEEYADMDIEERMEEMGEEVMEITLEELMAYIKKQRKKK